MPDYVRNGFSSVRPYVFGPHNILDFVEGPLNGRVLARHQQDGNAQHVEVQVGDSVIVPELRDPPHEVGFPGSIYVYVEDVDLVAKRAEDYEVKSFLLPMTNRTQSVRLEYAMPTVMFGG